MELIKHAPLVSVCIPVYNGSKYIKETVRSVLAQNYSPLEILAQDNASDDDTWEILSSLSRRHPELFITRNDVNVGMARNWNLVINRARGDYIMLLSADDLLESGHISSCMKIFNQSNIDAVSTNHYWLIRNKRVKRRIAMAEGPYKHFDRIVLLRNPFSINFTLFKRDTLEQLKRSGNVFHDTFITCDYDFWIRLAFSGKILYYSRQYLGTYRVHNENLSRQTRRMMRHTVLVVLSHKKALKRSHPVVYAFTLTRFMYRLVRNYLLYNISDIRIFRILWRELFSFTKV